MSANTEEAEIRLKLSNGQQVGNTLRELQKQANRLRAEIRDLEPDTQEFVDKARDLKKVTNALTDIQDQVKNVEEAQASLNDTMMEYIPFSGQIQAFVKGYRDLGTVTAKTTVLTKVFGRTAATAMAATGIGLLLIAFAGLVNWISKAQVVTDFFAKSAAALQNVLNVLSARVIALIKLDFGRAFKGFASDISNAAKAGWENAAALKEIAKEEKQLELQRSRSRAEIERLKKLSEDTTQSLAVQAKAAKDANDMEQALFALQVQVESKRVKILKERNKEAERNGMLTDEMTNEAIEAEVKLNESKEESYGKQTELQNKLNELNRTASEEQRARAQAQKEAEDRAREEKLAKEQEYNQMILEASKTLQDQQIALITDQTEREIAQTLLQYERDIQAFKGSEDQKAEYAKQRKKQLDQELAVIDDEVKKQRNEKAFADLEKAAELEESKIQELFFNKLISEEQRNEQLYQAQVAALQKRLALLISTGSTETLEYQKIYTELAKLHADYEEGKTKVSEENSQKRMQLEQQGLQAAASIFAGFAELLDRDEENRKKNWKTIKALRKAEIAANLPTEISNIWKNANMLPVPFNGIVGGLQTALAVARSLKQVSDLEKVRYQQGGPVFGRSHANGGIPFSVQGRGGYEMEGGEIILTKGVYQNPVLRTAASMINVAGGGASFASGGMVPLANSPVSPAAPGTVINNINQSTQDLEALISEVRGLREELTGWQTQFEVVLSLQKLEDEQSRKKKIEFETSF